MSETCNGVTDTVEDALNCRLYTAFSWRKSPEGPEYWVEIFENFTNNQ